MKENIKSQYSNIPKFIPFLSYPRKKAIKCDVIFEVKIMADHLSHCPFAAKRNHYRGNCEKRRFLICALFTVSEASSIAIKAGSMVAGRVLEK